MTIQDKIDSLKRFTLKSLQSIRNFFSWVYYGKEDCYLPVRSRQNSECTSDALSNLNWHYTARPEYNSAYLTQAELQLLQRVVARNIRIVDQVRKEIKEEALGYQVKSDIRRILFKQHREVKAYLRKLADLQHRLKHKVTTRG